jgi:hypothetical protein
VTLKGLKIRAEKQNEERRYTVKKFEKIQGIRGKKQTPRNSSNSAEFRAKNL